MNSAYSELKFASSEQRYQVAIAGQALNLVGDEAADDVQAAAAKIDLMVRELRMSASHIEPYRALMLVTLRVALEYHQASVRCAVLEHQVALQAHQDAKLMKLLAESEV